MTGEQGQKRRSDDEHIRRKTSVRLIQETRRTDIGDRRLGTQFGRGPVRYERRAEEVLRNRHPWGSSPSEIHNGSGKG